MRRSFGTHVGLVRRNNEDNHLGCELPDGRGMLLAVADGMGGYAAGEEASFLAIAALRAKWEELTGRTGLGEPFLVLLEGMRAANAAVYRAAVGDESRAGMGTTLTVAIMESRRVWVGHVGDSRLYLYRDDVLLPLTRDHSVVANLLLRGEISEGETQTHPQRHLLTNALGLDIGLRADYATLPVESGDILLLCTDGLTNVVCPAEISQTIRESPFGETAGRLIKRSLAAGGHDNITVLVVEV